MHLSLFSDALLPRDAEVHNDAARAHRDGLLRGLALLGVFAVLAGLTILGNTVRSADADAATFTCRPAVRAGSMLVGRTCGLRTGAPAEASVYLRP